MAKFLRTLEGMWSIPESFEGSIEDNALYVSVLVEDMEQNNLSGRFRFLMEGSED